MADLKLQNVSKVYAGGVRAVSDVSVEIEDGEFAVLVGPSGCGKSTLLRMIAGLEDVFAGEISIGGKVVNHVHAKDRDIAFVFQNYALYPHMTVAENLAFGLKMRKFPKAEIEKRVVATAEILGLTEYLNRKPAALSGGQRQRVAVGRAIVRQPKLFLFDEPLSNLDAKMRVGMRAELIKLRKRLGATMVYVTHDQTEAMSMGDRLIVMKDGIVQQVGAPLDIYHHPANQFVAGFIGSPPMNFLNAEIVELDSRLYLGSESLSIRLPDEKRKAALALGDKRVTLGIRPEDIHEKAMCARPIDENIVTARVEILEPLGSEILATCSLAEGEITARLSPRTQVKSEETVELVFDMERAKLFDPATGGVLL